MATLWKQFGKLLLEMYSAKKNETEVQNISRDQVEVVLKLEGQLLHEKVHVLVNLEPVQVVGVALEDAQVVVVFSFIFAMKKQVLKKTTSPGAS